MCTCGSTVWMVDMGDSGWDAGWGIDDGQLSGGHNVHCSSDGCTGDPHFTTV